MMGGYCFKPTEGGYVFRAPNPWGMMPAKHYFFVNDAQKAQIKDRSNLPARLLAVVWLVSITLFIGGPFLFGFFYYGFEGPENPEHLDVAGARGVGNRWSFAPPASYQILAIASSGARFPRVARPTTERISRKERLEARSVSDYVRNCIGYGLAFGCCTFIAGQKFETLGTPHSSFGTPHSSYSG